MLPDSGRPQIILLKMIPYHNCTKPLHRLALEPSYNNIWWGTIASAAARSDEDLHKKSATGYQSLPTENKVQHTYRVFHNECPKTKVFYTVKKFTLLGLIGCNWSEKYENFARFYVCKVFDTILGVKNNNCESKMSIQRLIFTC